MLKHPIVQIAYFVPNLAEAAKAHAALYGSGPFFFIEHVPVSSFVHRGKPQPFDHSVVFGQWGEIMIEFFCQHNDAPSYCHDSFPTGSNTHGMQHVATFVDDLQQTIATYARLGCEVASTVTLTGGLQIAMIDTRRLNGHMVELYEKNEYVLKLYQMTREIAGSGGDLIRPLRPT